MFSSTVTVVPVTHGAATLLEKVRYASSKPVSYTHLDVYKRQALATASGAAAITYTIEALAQAGDHIVAQKTIYGGSYRCV